MGGLQRGTASYPCRSRSTEASSIFPEAVPYRAGRDPGSGRGWLGRSTMYGLRGACIASAKVRQGK